MTVATNLRAAQRARFAALDELLPDMTPNPVGEVLSAALPDGQRVAGTLLRINNPEGTLPSLWSARQVWELFPLAGEHADAGVDALLRAWRGLLDRSPLSNDSSCVLTWPSRDVAVSRVLLEHGFVPLTVLAVRQPGRSGTPVPRLAPGVTVRRARMDDLGAATEIAMAELVYSANLGGTVLRADAAELKQAAIRYHLNEQDPVWIIERDGIAVGIAECWVTDASVGAAVRFPVPIGRWGYVNTVSVLPGARGGGIGQQLMAVAHHDLARHRAIGSYLYYNPANPLSSVFWPRQGYRPLWTIWEIRPANALR
ncbi:MAG TPA: GNAT family N-acetyltransferase [Pseudonocardiaceae bacterium]|nr:GNAT family N-acetyltransferase [Pseudonocardiaceae bacterium]